MSRPGHVLLFETCYDIVLKYTVAFAISEVDTPRTNVRAITCAIEYLRISPSRGAGPPTFNSLRTEVSDFPLWSLSFPYWSLQLFLSHTSILQRGRPLRGYKRANSRSFFFTQRLAEVMRAIDPEVFARNPVNIFTDFFIRKQRTADYERVDAVFDEVSLLMT